MGEISELIQEGVLCMECGSLIEDLIQPGSDELLPGPGYPRKCKDCLREEKINAKRSTKKGS